MLYSICLLLIFADCNFSWENAESGSAIVSGGAITTFHINIHIEGFTLPIDFALSSPLTIEVNQRWKNDELGVLRRAFAAYFCIGCLSCENTERDALQI